MELEVLKSESAETQVGSYFVANYPPFSVWSAEHLPAVRQMLAAPGDSNPPLGLYLHIPFCRKRCRFCYFRVYTDKNSNEIEVYLDALTREIALYSDQPGLAGRQFDFVYFGGGTPSYLSSDQLKSLVDRINQHWVWDHAREVTFECEPGTLKESKLQTIKDIGVTRLSLGIEHFDDDVLTINGRAHKSPEVYQAYAWARGVGFEQINVDLIAGMVGETDDKWRDTVDKALALEPDSVTIYQMEVPHNTIIARESDSTGESVADWAAKRAWVDYAFHLFERAGYEVSSAYTLVKPSAHRGFVYRDALWHGADMVGTGVASFSHVGGIHYQNHDQWDDYVASIDGDALPLARAFPSSKRQLFIRQFCLQLKLGKVDAGYFRRTFGVEPRQEFAEPLAALVRHGLLNVTDDDIRLTRAGLLRVDALLPSFFEPQFQRIRYT